MTPSESLTTNGDPLSVYGPKMLLDVAAPIDNFPFLSLAV